MKSKKLALLHTNAVVIEPLQNLAKQTLPDCTVYNFLDDSILPQLAANGGDLEAVAPRWLLLFQAAEQAGADLILGGCSSVGEITERARSLVRVPVVRIDAPMAAEAVRRAGRIGVAATLQTTLGPTLRLLQRSANEIGKPVHLEPVLAGDAFQCLVAGDRAGHDRILAESLLQLAERTELVVLAQASMARVVASLPENQQAHFLSSPALAMQQVRQILSGDIS